MLRSYDLVVYRLREHELVFKGLWVNGLGTRGIEVSGV